MGILSCIEGASNKKTQRQLALESGLSMREIRDEISLAVRNCHEPIVSDSEGFWYTEKAEDIEKCRNRLIANLKAIAERVRAYNFILEDWKNRGLFEDMQERDRELALSVIADRQKYAEWEAGQGVKT